jgi:hypothetical protein
MPLENRMDNGDIFAKTAKGIEEIDKRTYHLDFKKRTALIQVDGHSAVESLLARIPGDGFQLLNDLLRDGFIASADGKTISVAAAPDNVTVPGGTAFDLPAAKERAAKAIESLLGPEGETLAIAIEHTKTLSEFAARAERTRGLIEQMRGAARANVFWTSTGL